MTRRATRLVLGWAVLVLGMPIATSAPVRAAAPVPCVAGTATSHAAIVVEHADAWSPPDAVLTECVGFSGSSVTAEQLLAASGIEYQVQSYGSLGDALCQVDDEPHTYSNCPGSGDYWSVYIAEGGGGWTYSNSGISTLQVADGEAIGLRYAQPGAGPPAISPWSICPAPQASPSPTPTPPPGTPRPAATATTRPGIAATVSPSAASTPQRSAAPPSASQSAAPASHGSTAQPTPTGAVEAITTGGSGTRPSSATAAAVTPPASVPALLGFGAIGALLGLATLQVLWSRKRRPTTAPTVPAGTRDTTAGADRGEQAHE